MSNFPPWVGDDEKNQDFYVEAESLGADNAILSLKRTVLKFIEEKKKQSHECIFNLFCLYKM